MIDTVVLVIPEISYEILDPKRFIPSTDVLDSSYSFGAKAFIKCSQNPTDEDYANGIYKPRLTVTKRAVKGGFIKPLKIEFSVPKLLFLNNVDELEDKDFNKVIDTLQKRLLEMAVEVSKTALILAQVSAIHYSKNIMDLPEFVTSSMVLRELAKVNITKRLSLDKTTFKDLGYALTAYSKSYSIVIYDKLKEIQHKTGVKIDNDPTILQQNLFSDNKLPKEILRIEIRLNKHYKLESMLKTIGRPKDRTFANVFKSDIARSIILYYWDLMTADKNAFLFSQESDIDKIAEAIYKNNPKISAQKLLAVIGYMTFSKQKGTRLLRHFIEDKYTARTWFRINNYSKMLSFYSNSTSKVKFWVDIRNAIEEFKPIKALDFQNQMINNDKYS
ncbi:MAG: hypothetical protein Q7R51_03325 [bacterium]|nr:hypothetical protein [bacterium]